MDPKKISKFTAPVIKGMKKSGRRISMLTAYDATFARLLDSCGVEILLVGDSLGMVIQGQENTLTVTLEDIIYHTRAVARGTTRAQVVADMPFMSYQSSVEQGLENAGRLVKEGRAEAVKLEGGACLSVLVSRLTEIGIPVMGHIGLTPQSVHAMGGYRVQGRGNKQARQLLDDALALQEAGAYSLVLEGVPQELARQITEEIAIPTIGIGAGPHCNGQVLVIYDLLGMDESFSPKFVKQYDNFSSRVRQAVRQYDDEVKGGVFPGPEHSFGGGKPRAKERLGTTDKGNASEPLVLYSGSGKKQR